MALSPAELPRSFHTDEGERKEASVAAAVALVLSSTKHAGEEEREMSSTEKVGEDVVDHGTIRIDEGTNGIDANDNGVVGR